MDPARPWTEVRRMRARLLLFSALIGCSPAESLDAPFAPPARQAGPCGTTEDLLPKLLAFVEGDRFGPLRDVIEADLVDADPRTAPVTLRAATRALLDIIGQIGVTRARDLVTLARDDAIEGKLTFVVTSLLRVVDGRVDGKARYEVAGAAGRFIRTCDAGHLLGALEGLLRLRASDRPERPWVVALLAELEGLLADPTVGPLLASFSTEGAADGRPAVVALLGQVMIFLADEPVPVPRVRTLFQSAVYPLVDPPLEARLERLLDLLAQATAPEAGILDGLRAAMWCGNRQREPRDVLLGFAYDLAADEALGLQGILRAFSVLRDTTDLELELLADLLRTVRLDLDARDELLGLLVVLLEPEAARRAIPVLLDLTEEGIVAEILDAIGTLFEGCEASS